jgi:hypothetical protein
VKINACADTGKTSTLEFLAQSTSRRGQYIAFNRDIVRDAKEKFPNTVTCSTSHGLAFKATPSAYRGNSDKMTKKVNANQLAEKVGVNVCSPDTNKNTKKLAGRDRMRTNGDEHRCTRKGLFFKGLPSTVRAIANAFELA